MKKKIVQIVLSVFAFAGLMFGAWGYAVYNNFELLLLHMALFAVLAYCLPIFCLKKELHMPIYTWEIIVGFMAFFWTYLNEFSRDLVFPQGVYGLLFTDGLELMIIGFCFAMLCIAGDNKNNGEKFY